MRIENLEWNAPVPGEWWEGLASTMTWRTACETYRVVRIDGAEPRFVSGAEVNDQDFIIQNNMNNLGTALTSVEKYHRKFTGCDEVYSNYDEIMADAEEHGLDKKPENRWVDSAATERLKTLREKKKQNEEFEIREEDARVLLRDIGYGKIDEFGPDKIKFKLNKLDTVEDSLKIPTEKTTKLLLEDCLQALAKGRRIVFKKEAVTSSIAVKQRDNDVPSNPPENVSEAGFHKVPDSIIKGVQSSEECYMITMKEADARRLLGAAGYQKASTWPVATLARKLLQLPKRQDRLKLVNKQEDRELIEQTFKVLAAGGANLEVKGEAVDSEQKHTKPSEGTDFLGSRLGSNHAKANAVLTKTPKRMAQIMKDANLSDTVYNHMNRLAKEGHINKTDEGYFLKDGPVDAEPNKTEEPTKASEPTTESHEAASPQQ